MRTLAVLPVKSFEQAKTRTALDAAARERLAAEMVTRTLRTLTKVAALDGVIVVTSEERAAAPARRHGFTVVADPHEHGHSEAARLGVAAALAAGAERALLVPGDCPGLAAAELDDLLAAATVGVTIVADRHGTGTNALVLTPPDAIPPSFGPGSFARHAALARRAAQEVRAAEVPSLAFDVDTPADVEAARELLGTLRA